MRWRESVEAVRMDRVAVVAPSDRLEAVLSEVGREGMVQLERVPPETPMAEAMASALPHDDVSAFVGWSPRAAMDPLHERLASLGGAAVRLPRPRGAEPPTLVAAGGATGAFQPLVDTYATIPYADLDPALFAGPVYILMFGMMFGDVGHGALLLVAGLCLWRGHPKRLARLTHLAPFVIGAGGAAIVFGLLYGEAFGPTHLVPTLWTAPLDHPTELLTVGIAVGAGLLGMSYVLGSANRWREGGPARALLATTGLAGAGTYLGLGLLVLGWFEHLPLAMVLGALLAVSGVVLGFLGCYARSGGVLQSTIELFDSVLRMGTNTVSFARLAAFGLTHAALERVVWSGTTDVWRRGAALWVAAAALFLVGNALSFALEGLVAGIQALRLDYYELFSRIFESEGQPFRPWRVGAPVVASPPLPMVSLNAMESMVSSPLPKEGACSRG